MKLIDVLNLFSNKLSEAPHFLIKILETIVVIIVAVIIVKFCKMVIIKFFHTQKNFRYQINDKRADTLSTLLVSFLKYTIFIVTGLTIANSIFGINIATILAAAGIGGIAIGFGAQSLVKDVISGFFILLEDQIGVGDSVTIDGMSGDVEEIEMRITKIRHFNGDLFIIPNGEIKKVINHSRGSKTAIVDVKVSYQQNLNKVINVLTKLVQEFADKSKVLVEEPKVLGVIELSTTDITIRVVAKTLPNDYISVERELRKQIKEVFDQEKITIPYTKKVIITSDEDINEDLFR